MKLFDKTTGKKEYINSSKFKRFCTGQPYFVWNDWETKEMETIQESDDVNNLFWANFKKSNEDDKEVSYLKNKAISNSYGKVKDEFLEWFKRRNPGAQILQLKLAEHAPIILFNRTMEAIKSQKFDFIFNPVFIYENNNASAISRPYILDVKNQKISHLNILAGTKREDYIKAIFDFKVAQEVIPLKNYSVYIIEIAGKPIRKVINFREMFKINTQKRAPSCDKYDRFNCENKAGENTPFTVMDLMKKSEIYKEFEIKNFKYKDMSIDNVMNEINSAKNISKREKISSRDITIWADNHYIKELLAIDFPFEGKISGKIITKKNIINGKIPSNKEVMINAIKDGYIVINKEYVEEFVAPLKNKNNRIIWYDFEAFSMPFPVLDGNKPYNQLVSQVSIIETINDKIQFVENKVYDPSQENYLADFKDIINSIYADKANYFVVFNKTYENARLKEMIQYFESNINDLPFEEKEIEVLVKKVTHIIENTIDLAQLFQKISGFDLPFVFLPDLYGFFSIKKIEKHITKKNSENEMNLKVMVKPYSNLEIQNGLIAMEIAILRYEKIIGDNQWVQKEKQLKEYCENDVKAMLMVYYYVLHVLRNN